MSCPKILCKSGTRRQKTFDWIIDKLEVKMFGHLQGKAP